MIEKLNYGWQAGGGYVEPTSEILCDKINELVDAVNKLETMAKNTNTVLKSLVEENNIHEEQIDELQMKLEPEKCECAASVPVWETLQRTRKALDIAMDGLKRIEKLTEPSYKNRNLEALALAVNTFSGKIIEQINNKE